MDYEESVRMAHKARRETEDFINHYIHDQRKIWPLIRPPAPTSRDSVQIDPCPTLPLHGDFAALNFPPNTKYQRLDTID